MNARIISMDKRTERLAKKDPGWNKERGEQWRQLLRNTLDKKIPLRDAVVQLATLIGEVEETLKPQDPKENFVFKSPFLQELLYSYYRFSEHLRKGGQ